MEAQADNDQTRAVCNPQACPLAGCMHGGVAFSHLYALCGGEDGSLEHRNFRCTGYHGDVGQHMPASFREAGRPPRYSAFRDPLERLPEPFFTGTVSGDGAADEGRGP